MMSAMCVSFTCSYSLVEMLPWGCSDVAGHELGTHIHTPRSSNPCAAVARPQDTMCIAVPFGGPLLQISIRWVGAGGEQPVVCAYVRSHGVNTVEQAMRCCTCRASKCAPPRHAPEAHASSFLSLSM
eukprot:349824-Chlamydomonas_euryale.AAC.20